MLQRRYYVFFFNRWSEPSWPFFFWTHFFPLWLWKGWDKRVDIRSFSILPACWPWTTFKCRRHAHANRSTVPQKITTQRSTLAKLTSCNGKVQAKGPTFWVLEKESGKGEGRVGPCQGRLPISHCAAERRGTQWKNMQHQGPGGHLSSPQSVIYLS